MSVFQNLMMQNAQGKGYLSYLCTNAYSSIGGTSLYEATNLDIGTLDVGYNDGGAFSLTNGNVEFAYVFNTNFASSNNGYSLIANGDIDSLTLYEANVSIIGNVGTIILAEAPNGSGSSIVSCEITGTVGSIEDVGGYYSGQNFNITGNITGTVNIGNYNANLTLTGNAKSISLGGNAQCSLILYAGTVTTYNGGGLEVNSGGVVTTAFVSSSNDTVSINSGGHVETLTCYAAQNVDVYSGGSVGSLIIKYGVGFKIWTGGSVTSIEYESPSTGWQTIPTIYGTVGTLQINVSSQNYSGSNIDIDINAGGSVTTVIIGDGYLRINANSTVGSLDYRGTGTGNGCKVDIAGSVATLSMLENGGSPQGTPSVNFLISVKNGGVIQAGKVTNGGTLNVEAGGSANLDNTSDKTNITCETGGTLTYY